MRKALRMYVALEYRSKILCDEYKYNGSNIHIN